MKNHKRIRELVDELRLSIAEWASTAEADDIERLGERLSSLRTDLAELADGSYDPRRILGDDAAGGKTI